MTDPTWPKWYAERKERRAQAAEHMELKTAQSALAELLIEKHSGEFCSDLLKALQLNCGLDGFSVVIKAIAASEPGPQIYSLILRGKPPLWRTLSATIQFTLPQAHSIRIHPLSPESAEEWNIPLAPLPTGDGVGGLWDEHIAPLNPMRIAELIAKDMFDYVDPE